MIKIIKWKIIEHACLFLSSSVEVSVLGLVSTMLGSSQLSILPLPEKSVRSGWALLCWCSGWCPSLAAKLATTFYNQNKRKIML